MKPYIKGEYWMITTIPLCPGSYHPVQSSYHPCQGSYHPCQGSYHPVRKISKVNIH